MAIALAAGCMHNVSIRVLWKLGRGYVPLKNATARTARSTERKTPSPPEGG